MYADRMLTYQRDRDNGLFITLVPKPLLFIGLKTMETLVNLIGLFIKLSVQTFKPLILIYRSGNFVYQHWGCLESNLFY